MRLEYGASTNVGRVRRRNEDNYACAPDECLFIVADGMGGHPEGQLASTIAVNRTEEHFKQTGDLEASIRFADSIIRDTPPSGMGTTIVAASFTPFHVHVAHAGDSRLYLFRGGSLYALTQDHTVAGQSGSPDHSNQLLNAMGVGSESRFRVTLNQYPIQSMDIYVLCSDGLYGEISPAEMAQTMLRRYTMKELAEALVDAAVAQGGKDNVTVICVRTQ